MNEQIELKDDMLYGAAAIGSYIGLPRRTIYHAVANDHIPHFKIGDSICARKSTLTKWIAEQEAR